MIKKIGLLRRERSCRLLVSPLTLIYTTIFVYCPTTSTTSTIATLSTIPTKELHQSIAVTTVLIASHRCHTYLIAAPLKASLSRPSAEKDPLLRSKVGGKPCPDPRAW
jgi:hypothetical protein